MRRSALLVLACLLVLIPGACAPRRDPRPSTAAVVVSPRRADAVVDPSRWHGFNLLDMFSKGWKDGAFQEEDFRWIHELGFSFVRLPLDYRIWTNEDGTTFDEEKLRRIDHAIFLGQKHGLHVSLNLHRAPGYTVAKPAEKLNLWTDSVAEEAFVRQWSMFARRYEKIPAVDLSFNLLNEPANVDAATVERIMRRTCAVIWAIDPRRPIIVDGLQWGRRPLTGLTDLAVIQSTRGYEPSPQLTAWEKGKSEYPQPTWPYPNVNRLLFGPMKAAKKSELQLELASPFAEPRRLTIHVRDVSVSARLEIAANGRSIWAKTFVPGPGEGEWKVARYRPEWKIYQNRYDRDYTVELPAGTRTVRVGVEDGDWLSFDFIEIVSPGGERIRIDATTEDHDEKQATFFLGEDGGVDATRSPMVDRDWLRRRLAPWKALEARSARVFVGEFGAHAKTPHRVVLAWLEDLLATWKEAGWGWALWNFRGDFGILDSGRADVAYEDFHGHALDREMLRLLQAYAR